MDKRAITQTIQSHLHVLCSEIGERRVGSEGNRKATTYAENILKEAGWQTETTELSVMDWCSEGATLTCNGQSFEALPSPYSLGCTAKGELIAIKNVSQLEKTNIKNKIVLLYDDIAVQQLAPKNFPFWNPDEHKHIISVLEKGTPQALICATERNAATAGGVYPFPLFEDGDFDIPSVYMKDTEGKRLLEHIDQDVELVSKAKRIPETAFNVVARKNKQMKERIVISAHIDTKAGTPGAIDNGTGVAVVLTLAELLNDDTGKYPIELVLFNGEDNFGAPGQVKYIEQNTDKFGNILLNINIDGAGYKDGLSCFSPFELPENIHHALQKVLHNTPEIVVGSPWYQGDHSLFLQQGCSAIAVASQWLLENMESQKITHTPQDNLNVVNVDRVAECALGIAELISIARNMKAKGLDTALIVEMTGLSLTQNKMLK
jgi:aminopeptidase YwaD